MLTGEGGVHRTLLNMVDMASKYRLVTPVDTKRPAVVRTVLLSAERQVLGFPKAVH